VGKRYRAISKEGRDYGNRQGICEEKPQEYIRDVIEKIMNKEYCIELPIAAIGTHYGRLRIIKPSAEAVMMKSIKKYGQLTPIVVSPAQGDVYELIDGFKRLRAAGRVKEIRVLKATLLNTGIHASKAAMLQLNSNNGGVSDMEEAMIVHSLHREDGLSQIEIGVLLNRHKSWVSRRISLIEQLCEEVKEDIKLGLISMSIGRELAKLPRGNQVAVISSVHNHHLSCRETARLVSELLQSPASDHDRILRSPKYIISKDMNLVDSRLSMSATVFKRKLQAMQGHCMSVSGAIMEHLTQNDMICLSPVIGATIRAAQLAVESLQTVRTEERINCGNVCT